MKPALVGLSGLKPYSAKSLIRSKRTDRSSETVIRLTVLWPANALMGKLPEHSKPGAYRIVVSEVSKYPSAFEAGVPETSMM
jgi:hypothetical protein